MEEGQLPAGGAEAAAAQGAEAEAERARAALAAGDGAGAAAAFEALLAANPQHLGAVRGLAEALDLQGRTEEAAGQRALADALEADALARGGLQLLRQGHAAAAERALLAALDHDGGSTTALKALADMARMRGDFAGAERRYAALLSVNPHMTVAQAGHGALTGRPIRPAPGLSVPVPFVYRQGFLPAARRDEAFAYGMDHLADMQDATVVEEGAHEVRAQSRKARLLYEPPEICAWFVPLIEAALPEICTRLGVPAFAPARIELQMTLHTGGHFYRAHRDVSGPDEPRGEIDGRRVSFVYYMSRTPRPFSGGELRLYDCDIGEDPDQPFRGRYWDEHVFSRIEPADNAIVFFPSAAMHEVRPVDLDSPDPADGRLTLNGWVHGQA